MVRPAEKREAVEYLESQYEVSERHSCQVLKIYRSAYRRQPQRDEQAFLRMRITEIVSVRVRYGYRRIHVLLKREGWQINHKRVYRLYREEGLNLRNRANENGLVPQGRRRRMQHVLSMNAGAWTLYPINYIMGNGSGH